MRDKSEWKVTFSNGNVDQVCGNVKPRRNKRGEWEIEKLRIGQDYIVVPGMEIHIGTYDLRVIGMNGIVAWRFYDDYGLDILIGPYEVEFGNSGLSSVRKVKE